MRVGSTKFANVTKRRKRKQRKRMGLKLEVLTPSGSVIDATVDSVMLPGENGYLEVLENHRPLLGALRPGIMRYVENGETHHLVVGSGFVEIGAGQKVLVLVDRHIAPGQVDKAAADADLKAAEEALGKWEDDVEELNDKGQWEETAAHRAQFDKADWARAQLDAPQ